MYRPIDPIKEPSSIRIALPMYMIEARARRRVKTQIDVRDEAGNLVCTNRSTTFFHEAGGFGGPPMPKSDVVIPDRAPDYEEEDYISPCSTCSTGSPATPI